LDCDLERRKGLGETARGDLGNQSSGESLASGRARDDTHI